MHKFLDVFNNLLDEQIPKAYLIYLESRRLFLEGDLIGANRFKRLNHLLHNSEVPFTASIGKNTIFAYGGIGIIIHADAIIGERCNIGSCVTIGGDGDGVPIIGDDVYLSTGSKIIGNVKIGDGAIVGANAVVLQDVQPFSVVVGVPAIKKSEITVDNFRKYSGFYWCKNDGNSIDLFVDWYFSQKRAKMPLSRGFK